MPSSASIRSRGYLTHWENDHATYFVTFRLADSLPQKLVTEIRRERRQLERTKRVFGSAGVSPASFDPNRLTKLPCPSTKGRKLPRQRLRPLLPVRSPHCRNRRRCHSAFPPDTLPP